MHIGKKLTLTFTLFLGKQNVTKGKNGVSSYTENNISSLLENLHTQKRQSYQGSRIRYVQTSTIRSNSFKGRKYVLRTIKAKVLGIDIVRYWIVKFQPGWDSPPKTL